MKYARATTFIAALFTVCAVSVPLAAQAQSSNAPVTRADVQADLARVEQAGYDPHKVGPHYPADVQAVESRQHPQDTTASSDYGPGVGGTAASGNRAMPIAVQNNGIYQHH
ncbi:DUF4148 domain-containing protein [Paraburkholderia rhizosphaerae]|uniref:Uncharacterized protein DUF4148 n=1 Tax=Paraburkholderia rhizosphaerae TaxID=480658 RepID=A0A4R8LT64_9BURK|nr:DUF4148 domain-containing protein [Paraburkholderia rhizosphaerae]TDY50880.1 uncharacterized protein DUF4148 [Paraburkholderia rhizosphaerae]